MAERRIEDEVRNLWIELVEERKEVRAESLDSRILDELEKRGLVRVEGGTIRLTEHGKRLGRRLVRLHRLTERLLLDVLRMEEEVYERAACSVEHTITEELEEAICTLLGHPKICPHGKPIPPGECCVNKERSVERAVYSLSEMKPGEEGRVAYIHHENLSVIERLMTLGLMPGRKIVVQMTFPTFVVQVGNTRIAVDREIAEGVYVIKAVKHQH